MKWLIALWVVPLAFLSPSAHALGIAASPHKLNLGMDGEAVLRVFNPNEEIVGYKVSGFSEQEGVMESYSYEDIIVRNEGWFGEDELEIIFYDTKGSDAIAVSSALKIPITRYRPVRPLHHDAIAALLVCIAVMVVMIVLWEI